MKIGVLLKQVPDTETKINISNDSVDESGIKWVVNPYDEFAVEAALQLKEKLGAGEVVILSAGPARAVEAIRQALAMGADRGIRIDTAEQKMAPLATATVLAAAAKEENFEIIFAGKRSVDDDSQQVHIAVAELLNIPHVLPIEKFEHNDDNTALVQRPVSGGIKEMISVKLPAVFACDKGINEPRYASLPGIMKAKSKPIKDLNAAELMGDAKPAVTFSNYALPPEGRKGTIIEGEPAEAAAQLVKLLREEAKVI